MAQQSAGGLITEAVSTLTGGVSQQPDAVRLPTQAKEILNCLLSPTEGLKKRPPSEIVQNLWPVFEDFVTLAPYQRTTQDPSDVLPQVTVLTLGLEDEGTRFSVVIQYNSDSTPFGPVALRFSASYTVQSSDTTLTILATSIAAAINDVTGIYITAAVELDDTISLTAAENNRAFTVELARDVTTTNVTLSPSTIFSHVINRDINEKYLVLVANGKLTVVDLIARDFPTVTEESGAFEYLETVQPGLSIRAITVGDYTIITNGEITTSQINDEEEDNPTPDPQALVWVRQGDYGTTYTVILDGTEFTHTSSADVREEIDTTFIASALKDLIDADGDYTTTLNGSCLLIQRDDLADFTIETHDGLGDQSCRAIKGEIQSIEDLPARAIDGFIIKVVGDESTDKDDFYVRYSDDESVTKDGVWRETLKGGEDFQLAPETMPHILVRNTDGTFTFGTATWDDRLVGDSTSAPFPSFTGYNIYDLFFHKNRLGFVSNQNIVLSQLGSYYNLFRKSVQQLLDEDIIDYAIAATEIAPIRHVIPMQKELTLWSDREQFIFDGTPILTAKTAFADRVSSFECSHRAKPIVLGKDIIFVTDRNSATKVMEFYQTRSSAEIIADANDLTEVVPSYCVGKPLAICGGQNANMAFLATLSNTNDLYVYNYLFRGSQLVQSAWSTWRFQDGNILAIDFVENMLLLVIQRGPVVLLEKIDVLPADTDNQPEDFPSDHLVHLDYRFGTQDFTWFGVTVDYDITTAGRTTWVFAADDDSVPTNLLFPMKVVKKATATDPTTYELPDIQRDSPGSISAEGDWSDVDVWIGVEYGQQFEPSKLFLREQAEDGGAKAITDGKTFIRNLKLDYKGGYFKVEVTPEGRSRPYTYEFDGDSETEEGVFEVPVLNANDQVTIAVKNQSFRPAAFTGMSWDGMFQRRTGR